METGNSAVPKMNVSLIDTFAMGLNGTLTGDQIDFLSIVYLILLTPSIIGSFSVLVVSIVRWRNLREQVHLLVQLSLADLLAALILMFTTAMNEVRTDNSVNICQYGLPLSLTFNFITFLLVVIYAWKSKNAIQGWRARRADDEGGQIQCQKRNEVIRLYAIVWLIPIAMYLLYILTPFISQSTLLPANDEDQMSSEEYTKYCTSCILFLHVWWDPCSDAEIVHDTFIKVFLFLVVIPVMLSCSVIYYNVGKWYKRHEQQGLFPVEGDGRSRRRFGSVFSTTRYMVLVILFCWTPVLLVVLLSTLKLWINVDQYSLFLVYIIQAVTLSLQGFLNSVVYAWRRPNFTEAVFGENRPLLAQDPVAFFDESLSSPI